MRGTRLRRFFLCLFVLLPVQFGAAKLCEYVYGVEMWPALLSPSFAKIYEAGDVIEVPRPHVFVTFAGTSGAKRVEVPVRAFLGRLPGSHRRSVMRRQFSHDYGLAPGAAPAPATARWAAQRLRVLYPGRTPRRLAVRWVRSDFRRRGAALRPVRTVPFDSVFVSLSPAPRPR